MTNKEIEIFKQLQSISFVIHSYNIGDKEYFISRFPKFKTKILDNIWQTHEKKTPIVTTYCQISESEEFLVKNSLKKFGYNESKLLNYLSSPIDKKTNINSEAALRKLIAIRYINHIEYSLNNYPITDYFLSEVFINKRKSQQRHTLIGVIVIITITFSLPRVIEGLTPVKILARKYHEDSRYKFSGSLCKDGWKSHSRGRGTCSHHGGIKFYFEKGEYSLTYDECLKKARETSWRE